MENLTHIIDFINVRRLYPTSKIEGIKAIHKPKEGWLTVHIYTFNEEQLKNYINKLLKAGYTMIQLKIDDSGDIKYPDYSISELISKI